MGRIRTIKPEFFKHEELFDAELDTGLPLRLAFAGLWTVCDREGRFEWRVRALKTDILPYDQVDFASVLDALASRGFVVRYRVGEREYGVVPGFTRHQVINNRETGSKIPQPPEAAEPPSGSTRKASVHDASATRHDFAQEEGKGKQEERKGKGASTKAAAPSTRGALEPQQAGGGTTDPEQWTDDWLWQEVVAAVGLQNGPLPTYWQPPAAVLHVGRWGKLGLSCCQIVDTVRASRAQHDEPPRGPKALDGAMQRLVKQLREGSDGGLHVGGSNEVRLKRWERIEVKYDADPPREAASS